jgi:hypothetical protein
MHQNGGMAHTRKGQLRQQNPCMLVLLLMEWWNRIPLTQGFSKQKTVLVLHAVNGLYLPRTFGYDSWLYLRCAGLWGSKNQGDLLKLRALWLWGGKHKRFDHITHSHCHDASPVKWKVIVIDRKNSNESPSQTDSRIAVSGNSCRTFPSANCQDGPNALRASCLRLPTGDGFEFLAVSSKEGIETWTRPR